MIALVLLFAPPVFADSTVIKPHLDNPAREYFPDISFLYCTDRELKKNSFTAANASGLSFGEARMILRLHYLRQNDKACDWWRLRDPSENKTGLLDLHRLDAAGFAASLGQDSKDQTFIYVHGFSTSFEQGAKEAAQIAYDLQLPGRPVLYSWPSQGNISLASYKIDQDMVNRPESIGHLTAFLKKVLKSRPRGRIHLVGFSMGTYLLTRSLMELAEQGQDLSKFGAVILISADIDTQDFKNLYFPKLKKALGGRLVLYVSGRDQALVLSSTFHQGRPRVGQGGDQVTTLEGAATIDATQSSLDCGICHGLSQINGVINDMYLSLHQGLPLEKRLVDKYEKNGEKYYVLFDAAHQIATIKDHNFAVAGQIGTFTNTFKLVWLPDPALEIATGGDRGFLPQQIELRWNLQSGNLRPYLDAGLHFFNAGGGETAWATHEGAGLEYAFDSGLGFGLEWDLVSELYRSPVVTSGSDLDALLKNNNFPWSGFHIQLIQYFDFKKLLE
jgi:esterase/lipase superfamily enzyme